MRRPQRGFSLLETLIALILVAISMTALIVAFVNSGQYGVLSRRQATALTVARTLAEQLNHAPWTFAPTDATCTTTGLDPRLLNNNTGNDANIGDPNGVFAQAALPTGADTPDYANGIVQVGTESYDTYVNSAYQNDTDPSGASVFDGVSFAVIVRYKVGQQFMRAVALGYRYCPKNMSVGSLPL
jgi:prepilin-type N-terminal cleavage/methylation domain-containing protein